MKLSFELYWTSDIFSIKEDKNKFWNIYTFSEIVFCHADWLLKRSISLNLEEGNKNPSCVFLTQRIYLFMVIQKLSASELLLSVKVSMKTKLSSGFTDSDVKCPYLSENPSHLPKNDTFPLLESQVFPSPSFG